MNFNDILGAGKFGEKLLNVVSKGVGTIYNDIQEPKRLEKKGELEAENRKKMIIAEAQGISEAIKIRAKTDLEIRTLERLSFQENKKQKNIDDILEGASKMGNGQVSDKKVDEEWITRFFNVAGEISSKEAQLIWSKILAGEIKQPGSYSLRTLEVIRNISTGEAEIFNKIAGVVSNGDSILKLENGYGKISDISGVLFKDLLILDEAGLISAKDLEAIFESAFENTNLIQLNFKNKIIYCKSNKKKITLPCLKLNKAGTDVFNLISPPVNELYFEELKKYLISQGCTLEITKL